MERDDNTDLLTWFDVERRIAQRTNGYTKFDAPVQSVSTYSESVDIHVAESVESKDIAAVLRDWFTEAELEINHNDAPRFRILLKIGEDSGLPVEISSEPGAWSAVPTILPLWRRLAYIGASGDVEIKEPSAFQGPEMIAFHSFKGGVGRTTSLVAFALGLIANSGTASEKKKILIIDGDTEAPGITYWAKNTQRGSASYVRLLEALHSPPSSISDSLNFFAKDMEKNSVEIDGTEVFILPAFVNQADLLNSKILPEHLLRSPNSPWALGDHLNTLGEKLGVSHVFIDLRAGLSELSSPVLFDPRFHRFVVTTLAEQSMRGVELLLETLRHVWNALSSSQRARHPYIILSMLSENQKSASIYLDARERLERAYGINEADPQTEAEKNCDGQSKIDEPEDLLRTSLTFFESGFSTELLTLRDLDQAVTALRSSPLADSAGRWFTAQRPKNDSTSPPNTIELLDTQARKLANTCKAKLYAENEEPSDLLITEALRNLGRSFAEDIPNAVLIGAKGSGKTFSFLQIAYARTWADFLQKINIESNNGREILVLPLLRSNELGDANKDFVNERFENVLTKAASSFGAEQSSFTLSEIQDRIERERAKGSTQLSDWVSFWTITMATSVNSDARTLSELNQQLAGAGLAITFLFDGIEDVLRDVLTDDVQKAAVEAIIELPNRIRELRQPAIGVLAFVREDYAKAVKTQNFGQFHARYEKFRLNWSPREFLQLILWLCADTGIDWVRKEQVDALDTESIVERLEKLWGKKLGRDDAAEAYSARWVYAALSDLRGRLQARDAVRFLGYAAQQASAKRLSAWTDRVLPPSAIRAALLPTSQEKVREAIQEYAPLKEWSEKLQDIDSTKKKIPFVAEDLGLEGRLRQSLQEIGVIYEDIEKVAADRIYVPEIYRHGLGLGSSAGARPRVQALLQRSLGTLPF